MRYYSHFFKHILFIYLAVPGLPYCTKGSLAVTSGGSSLVGRRLLVVVISWLYSPSAAILDPQNIKSLTVSIVYPSISHEVMGLDAIILVFLNVEF